MTVHSAGAAAAPAAPAEPSPIAVTVAVTSSISPSLRIVLSIPTPLDEPRGRALLGRFGSGCGQAISSIAPCRLIEPSGRRQNELSAAAQIVSVINPDRLIHAQDLKVCGLAGRRRARAELIGHERSQAFVGLKRL